uniref:ABC transporter permease subunit n=1 Tax=Clostridium sp. NkU-1 TaxID=1095009 RepID=UPI000A6EEDB2
MINGILKDLGRAPVQWYMKPEMWPFILVFMYLWKSCGYNMVIYLSAITGIDTTLYEAAVVDGAGKGQQVWYITLPCLKNVILMMFILNVGKIFYSDFGLFYQLSQGAGGSIFNTTATIDTYVFNALQFSTPIGMTSAATFFSICVMLYYNSCGQCSHKKRLTPAVLYYKKEKMFLYRMDGSRELCLLSEAHCIF